MHYFVYLLQSQFEASKCFCRKKVRSDSVLPNITGPISSKDMLNDAENFEVPASAYITQLSRDTFWRCGIYVQVIEVYFITVLMYYVVLLLEKFKENDCQGKVWVHNNRH